jgi:hypothetical protein
MGPELGPSRVYHFRQDITLDSITLYMFYCTTNFNYNQLMQEKTNSLNNYLCKY